MPETFPNAPLVRAIFQARFPGDAAVEVARARIQVDVRSTLPKLYVPLAVPGIAPALQAYVFKSEDESEALEIAINSLTYMSQSYPGFAAFKARVLELAQVFSSRVPEVQRLNRVGLRYVNHIPVFRELPTSAIPIRDYVNVGLTLPGSIPEANLTELNSVFTVQMDGGSLRVLLKNEKVQELAGQEMLVLDFDFSQVNALNIEGLAGYLDIAHSHTKRVFMDLMSEPYFRFVQGEIQ